MGICVLIIKKGIYSSVSQIMLYTLVTTKKNNVQMGILRTVSSLSLSVKAIQASPKHSSFS